MPEDQTCADRVIAMGSVRTEVQGHVGRDPVEVPRDVDSLMHPEARGW